MARYNQKYDWHKANWKEPTGVIAEKLGCDPAIVSAYRKRHGKAKGKDARKTRWKNGKG